MKKLGAWVCLLCVAVGLSACSVFDGNETHDVTLNDNRVVVYAILDDDVMFDVNLFINDPASLLAQFKLAGRAQADADPTAPYIQDAQIDAQQLTRHASGYPYPIVLTIGNLPDVTITLNKTPWEKWYQYQYFNPLTIVPEVANFHYLTGYTFAHRFTRTNATQPVARDDDGNYIYLWDTADDITLTEREPNTPLYYLLALAGAVTVGVATYLIKRKIDCKKRAEKL